MPTSDPTTRHPVHTVYGGAHLFAADTGPRLGDAARRALREYAPDGEALAEVFDLDRGLAARVYPRLVEKLEREPVEDFRIDFEDGFGTRSDEEEDRYAHAAADEMVAALAAGTLPAGIGIRIKNLGDELRRRSLRTLELFVERALERGGGALPPGFVVTQPKISGPREVEALVAACDALERRHGLAPGTLRIELMVETPQSIVAADGAIALPRLVAAGGGRVVGAHFGTYDYTASLGITAAHQHMRHPACDFAKHVMQVALAGTGVRLSDGATVIMPIGPHRAPAGGALTPGQRRENAAVVQRAWRLHAADVRHSLVGGFYQGWDLTPAQIPSRFATVYAFFLEGIGPASERLRAFIDTAARATLVGDVFDDAATGQGLLNYFLRALGCGAITEAEATELSGLSVAELQTRSFTAIMAARRV